MVDYMPVLVGVLLAITVEQQLSIIDKSAKRIKNTRRQRELWKT